MISDSLQSRIASMDPQRASALLQGIVSNDFKTRTGREVSQEVMEALYARAHQLPPDAFVRTAPGVDAAYEQQRRITDAARIKATREHVAALRAKHSTVPAATENLWSRINGNRFGQWLLGGGKYETALSNLGEAATTGKRAIIRGSQVGATALGAGGGAYIGDRIAKRFTRNSSEATRAWARWIARFTGGVAGSSAANHGIGALLSKLTGGEGKLGEWGSKIFKTLVTKAPI